MISLDRDLGGEALGHSSLILFPLTPNTVLN